MLNQNHPEDERLSALASREADAVADVSLADHLATCVRCADLVAELRVIRASLAELPDVQPHRPLRLLPEMETEPRAVDRAGGWARRFFAPVLTAGAALAMVGLVGTAAPSFGSFGAGAAAASQSAPGDAAAEAAASNGAGEPAAAPSADMAIGTHGLAAEGTDGGERDAETMRPLQSSGRAYTEDSSGDGDEAERLTSLPAERSPWPMVLFSGVALMVAAGLLRWVMAPRAG